MDTTLTKEGCISACRRLFLEDSTCKPAKKTFFYHACHEGKKRAFEESCFDRCSSKAPLVPSQPYRVCKHNLQAQAQESYWCRKGFIDASKRVKPFVDSFLSAENRGLSVVRVYPPLVISEIVEENSLGSMQREEKDHEKDTGHSTSDLRSELDLETLSNTTTISLASQEIVVSSNSNTAIYYHLDNNKLPLWYNTGVDSSNPAVGDGVANTNNLAPVHRFPELTDNQTFENALTNALFVNVGGFVDEQKQPSNTQLVDTISFVPADFKHCVLYSNLILPLYLFGLAIDQDNPWTHHNRAKTKEDNHTVVSYKVECLNALHVLSKSEDVSKCVSEYRLLLQAMCHKSFGRIKGGNWYLEDVRILESSGTDLDGMDPSQLSFGELSSIWLTKVPFDQNFSQDQEFDCDSHKIMSSAGILHQSIYSLKPSLNYLHLHLHQVFSSSDLMNDIDPNLLLPQIECHLPPRSDASFTTAANSVETSRSKQLWNPTITLGSKQMRCVLRSSSLVTTAKFRRRKIVPGLVGIVTLSSQIFTNARKALVRGITEECRHHFHPTLFRGAFISCINMTHELYMTHSNPILIPCESFATVQLRLREYPNRAKFKEHHVHICRVSRITTAQAQAQLDLFGPRLSSDTNCIAMLIIVKSFETILLLAVVGIRFLSIIRRWSLQVLQLSICPLLSVDCRFRLEFHLIDCQCALGLESSP